MALFEPAGRLGQEEVSAVLQGRSVITQLKPGLVDPQSKASRKSVKSQAGVMPVSKPVSDRSEAGRLPVNCESRKKASRLVDMLPAASQSIPSHKSGTS